MRKKTDPYNDLSYANHEPNYENYEKENENEINYKNGISYENEINYKNEISYENEINYEPTTEPTNFFDRRTPPPARKNTHKFLLFV